MRPGAGGSIDKPKPKMNAKAKTYSIETDSFDSELYGQPWIAVADFTGATDTDREPVLDYYGEGVQPSAGFYPVESNTPGSYGRVQIMCEPGTILCHGITRKKRPGAKSEVSRLWYIAGEDGEAISLLPMGGFDFAYKLAGEPQEARLDRFRTVKSIERGDGGAGMVGKLSPQEKRAAAKRGAEKAGAAIVASGILAAVDCSPVALEFSDYQALQRALCRGVVDCESAIKLHSGTEDGDDTERKERRAYLVASYEKELAEYQGLKAKLRSVYIDGAPGRMVSI